MGQHLRLRRRRARRGRQGEGEFTAPAAATVSEGDVISIDGTTGEVFLGEVPVGRLAGGAVLRGRRARRRPTSWSARWPGSWSTPTRSRRLGVRANADTAEDAARARRFGAEGIGLCRTEHMFLGERRQLVENLIVAEDDDGQREAARGAAAAAAAGLRRDPRGDGRAAGDDPADRPAAARVPARLHRPVRRGGPRGRREGTARQRAAQAAARRCGGCTSRTRCSACAACGSAS